ncbi:hypothetical protein D3C73_834200 [compost metagenome]
MIARVRRIAVKPPVAVHVGGVIASDLGQMDRPEQIAATGLDPDLIQARDIDHRDVEGLVRLVLQRTVQPAVDRVERQIAQMAGPADQRPDQPPLKVVLGQQVGEGIIDEAAFDIDGDPLHMAGIPGPAVLVQRQALHGVAVGRRIGGLRPTRRDSDQHGRRQRQRRDGHRRYGARRNTELHAFESPPPTERGSRANS